MAALFEPFVWMLGIVVNIYFTVVLAEVVLHWLVRFGIVDVKNVYFAKISGKGSGSFGVRLLPVYPAAGFVVSGTFHLPARPDADVVENEKNDRSGGSCCPIVFLNSEQICFLRKRTRG